MRTRLKPGVRDRSRELRNAPTPAERKLWRALRQLKREGFHFRRQVPFRGFYLDFVEHTQKLVIEVDGDTHGTEEGRLKDKRRDAVLTGEGYCVLRFWNSEVHDSVEGVVLTILLRLNDGPPP